jgi:hypothetical protein
VRAAVIADGAPWIWKILKAAFPDGVQILDRYHCKQYLWAFANVQFGEGSGEARHWVESVQAWLDLGDLEQALEAVLDLEPSNEAARSKYEPLLEYLGEHVERFDYLRRKRQGYPIGSGAMESAHRFIMQVRLNIVGAWWLEDNCNGMLSIRCAIYNGTFDQVFERYMDHVRARDQPEAACLAA